MTLVGRFMRRRETFECMARDSHSARRTRVDRAAGLVVEFAEVNDHLVAGNLDAHLDVDLLFQVDAVVVEKAVSEVHAVRNF
jgi:hypothetical protein